MGGKKKTLNDSSWRYFALFEPILVTFTLYFLWNQLLEMISFPQCALRFFIAPLDFDLELFEAKLPKQTYLVISYYELFLNF